MAMPSASELAFQKAHVHDDQRTEIAVSNAICLLVIYVAVALRFVSRRLAGTTFGMDDGWIWAAMVFGTLFVIGLFTMVHYGFGRHSILVGSPKGLAISTMVTAVLYHTSNLTIKISILYLYRRIFPQKWLKYCLFAIGCFAIGQHVTFNLTTIFQCVPINAQWNPEIKARWVDYGAASLVEGVLNVTTQVMILTIPMPIVARLQLPNNKKRLVMTTFLLGGLVCVISAVRLGYIRNWTNADPAYNNVHTTELSAIEVSIGTLSACLPVYKPIYNYYFHHGKATTKTSSSRSKPYGPLSTNHVPIKMLSARKQWSERGVSRGNDDEERLYHQLGTTALAQRNENLLQHHGGALGIVVTREFTTSSSDPSIP